MSPGVKRFLELTVLVIFTSLGSLSAIERPNIFFLSIDDLNDKINPMGYEGAITPNFDRLAEMGVTFQNAHTSGVFCAPARSAIFTGQHASTTGCYTTQIYFMHQPELKPMQVALKEGGYATYGGGKLFHHPAGYIDMRGWDEFFVRSHEQKQKGWPLNSWTRDHPAMPEPYPNSVYNQSDKPTKAPWFLEWGAVLDENEAIMSDTIRTEWACDVLERKHETPFFLGLGLYATHFPNYVPQQYFDLYNRDDIVVPEYLEDDLEDLPEHIKVSKYSRGKIHEHLEKIDAVKDAIHGYLACVSYVDAMLGRLLDAIESGPNANNTIIVLWSDHGYHQGEKRDWGKHTLWERTSNVPFMWAGPGIAKGVSIETSVSLIDMYPTIMDFCHVTPPSSLEGVSLVPILKNPDEAQDRDIYLPGMKPNEYAIMNQHWRYIHYANGTEELYNVQNDPNEWNNLAEDPEYDAMKKMMAGSAPMYFAEPGPEVSDYQLKTDGHDFEWVLKN